MKTKSRRKSSREILCSITVSIAIFILCMLLTAPLAAGNETGGLIDKVSGKAETIIYFKDIKKGLRPFLRSGFYREAEDLSIFKGPIRTDVSAPAISTLGDVEKSLGLSITPGRIILLMGKDAAIYKTRTGGGKASVAVLEVGWLKRFLIKIVSSLKGSISRENIDGISAFSTNAGNKKVYYALTASHVIFSDSSLALKSQYDTLAGGGDTIVNNPDFKRGISAVPAGYHVLIYHKITKPEPYETKLIKRGERLLGEVDTIFTSITFTKSGADVSLYAPLKSDETEKIIAGLGDVGKKPAPEIENLPSEAAGFVAFNSYDPTILYANFVKNWFSGVFEQVNYISILQKWKTEAGFDLEGGILSNITGGTLLAVTGIGYEGREPYVKVFSCLGIREGGEEAVSENLSNIFDYAFWDDGPSYFEYNRARLYYMGELREEEVDWSGSKYIKTSVANPGFGINQNRLYFYRDISTIERLLNAPVLNKINEAGGKKLFDEDFLVKSGAYLDAQKDLPLGNYDLYLYLSGENLTNTVEKYIINLNAHYRYFLYEDAEKRLIPLLELTRESFVSFYGGINFGQDAIEGKFRLVAKDLN
ncbi:MAG: hypothetical protein JW984_08080 [Deltaproteobacteria bacterium]|uniref:Uncharacterized protein n=1 Tax=Candidatus Zymogenus saltonus TaxID=2844893 RepID=A0A9D8PP60_9DELT|nr:hypothetical protein [Candidatus Zymogenus saltonus]